MLINVHKAYREIVSVCDEDLLGKVFEEGKAVLNVRESFYNGEKIDDNELLKLMQDLVKSDVTFNIVGEKSIKIALKAGIISEEGVKKIQGIPYALVLL